MLASYGSTPATNEALVFGAVCWVMLHGMIFWMRSALGGLLFGSFGSAFIAMMVESSRTGDGAIIAQMVGGVGAFFVGLVTGPLAGVLGKLILKKGEKPPASPPQSPPPSPLPEPPPDAAKSE